MSAHFSWAEERPTSAPTRSSLTSRTPCHPAARSPRVAMVARRAVGNLRLGTHRRPKNLNRRRGSRGVKRSRRHPILKGRTVGYPASKDPPSAESVLPICRFRARCHVTESSTCGFSTSTSCQCLILMNVSEFFAGRHRVSGSATTARRYHSPLQSRMYSRQPARYGSTSSTRASSTCSNGYRRASRTTPRPSTVPAAHQRSRPPQIVKVVARPSTRIWTQLPVASWMARWRRS